MNLTIIVPQKDGSSLTVTRHVKDPRAYLDRVASDYPEGTQAIFHTGRGTHQYRKHYRGSFEFTRQTIGP
jgi:hypothetical protein